MDDFRVSYDLENNRVKVNRQPVCMEEYAMLRAAVTDMTIRWTLVEAAKKAEKEKENPLSYENIRRMLRGIKNPRPDCEPGTALAYYRNRCKYTFCNRCGHIYKREDFKCDRCGHVPFTDDLVKMS